MGIKRHRPEEIECANPDTLYRIFGTADWGNREKFTDELLKDLIEGFLQSRLATTPLNPTSSVTPMSTSLVSSPTLTAATRLVNSTPPVVWCG